MARDVSACWRYNSKTGDAADGSDDGGGDGGNDEEGGNGDEGDGDFS